MRVFLLFVLLSLSNLHAQWLIRPGYMNCLYIDPVLMKANHVTEFRMISNVHEGKDFDKEFRSHSWVNKDDYWLNEDGFVFGGGMRMGSDSLIFYHYAPVANNPNVWTMIEDSMRFSFNRVELIDTNGIFDTYTVFDTLGRLIQYRSYYKKEGKTVNDYRFEYHYANGRLDSMVSSGRFMKGGRKFIYNSEGQLVREICFYPQYYSEPDSNCYRIDGIAEYTYDKRGLLKMVKETYDHDKTYWTIARFRWRCKKK